MLRLIPIIILLYFLFACKGSTSSNNTTTEEGSSVSVELDSDVNSILSFWDDFNFKNSDEFKNPEIGEQNLVDFLAALSNINSTDRIRAIDNMLDRASIENDSYRYFLGLFHHYLYDPNSPMQDDVTFELVLRYVLDKPLGDEAEDFKLRKLYELVKRNQPGDFATDIDVLLSSGEKASLKDFETRNMVLFFYEPGCQYCEQVVREYKNNDMVNQKIKEGALSILAIYPYGDKSVWEDYQSEIPSNWINAMDENMDVLKGELYDLKATPTIYFLDKQKRVVYKDVDADYLLYELNQI